MYNYVDEGKTIDNNYFLIKLPLKVIYRHSPVLTIHAHTCRL